MVLHHPKRSETNMIRIIGNRLLSYGRFRQNSLIAGGLFILLMSILKLGFPLGYLFSIIPLAIYTILILLQKPFVTFSVLYVVNFFIMGLLRYVNLPIAPGILVDILIGFTAITIVSQNMVSKTVDLKRLYHPLFFLSLFWLVYCLIEAINPESNIDYWLISIRSLGAYMFLFCVLTSLIFSDFRTVKKFILLWSVLILLAALKAIIQKHVGLDNAERIWLYTAGANTHLIYSGIRYFSFFSDAANFGCQMGLAMVVFAILLIYEKSKFLKIYYLLIVLLSYYAMMISGTRAAIVVPFVGLACFIVINKQWKWVILGSLLFILAFGFFNFTNIGQGNSDIRRMRTAFRAEHDDSYNLRLENQKKMKQFMGNYPFGVGIGSAKHTQEGDLLYKLPTDTSLVYVWVETGVVGLILYIAMYLIVIGFGMYYVMFKLQHPMVRGVTAAFCAGLSGMLAAGYANEVLHQFPAGPTLYMFMTFIMLSPYFDKELNDGK